MSFAHKTVVIIGATGVVGGGIVRKYLDAGATVVGVSRSAANLQKLRQKMNIVAGEPFHGVVANFKDEGTADQGKEAITAALAGKPIDHVVSVQGFVEFAKPPTHSALDVLKAALDDGFYNNYLAAKVLLPELKSRDGATFTLASGFTTISGTSACNESVVISQIFGGGDQTVQVLGVDDRSHSLPTPSQIDRIVTDPGRVHDISQARTPSRSQVTGHHLSLHFVPRCS